MSKKINLNGVPENLICDVLGILFQNDIKDQVINLHLFSDTFFYRKMISQLVGIDENKVMNIINEYYQS